MESPKAKCKAIVAARVRGMALVRVHIHQFANLIPASRPIALGYHAEANKVLGNFHNRPQGVCDPTGENQTVRQSGPDRDHQPPRSSHLPPRNGQ